jgi:hypothetical protein
LVSHSDARRRYARRAPSPFAMFALAAPSSAALAGASAGAARGRSAAPGSSGSPSCVRAAAARGGAPRISVLHPRGGVRLGGRGASTRSLGAAADDAAEVDLGADSDASFGASAGSVFPRVKERDPYRRLGISSEATYEEVQDARNYLVDTYRGHVAGVEAIEAAFDRIIQDKLASRKKAGGLRRASRKKQGEDYVPPFLERLKARFAKPDDQTIARRAAIYAIMAGWAIVQSSSSGPAFQMAISFGLTVYFLNEKRGGDKAMLGKAFINAFVALCLGWLVGSVFPVYIPIFPQEWSPELVLSLFSFVSFFIFATFLK